MGYFTQGRFQQQASFLRRQFLQDGDLPFTDVLTEEVIAQALTAISVCWLDRIFSPLVTLWVFLGQVLSADHSCRGAVARLIAHRVSRGQSPCSAETGAYCQARKRLPEKFFSDVARQTGRALEAKVDPKHGIEPRSISFKGAVQTLEAFQPIIALQGEQDAEFRASVYAHLLDAIASHRVADRPDRFEPRRKKRRPKPYDRLMKPRHEAKREMLNGFRET
jgi:hypothetical protein